MRLAILLGCTLVVGCSDNDPPHPNDDVSPDDMSMTQESSGSDGGDGGAVSNSGSSTSDSTSEPSTMMTDSDASQDASGATADELPEASVTWHADIAPLVAQHCAGCHQSEGIAPFSLETYASAEPFAELALERIQDGSMPPWGAQDTDECEVPHAWLDDPRLSPEEVELFEQWVAEGAVEGDASEAADLPEAPNLALQDPDLSVDIGTEVTVEGTDDQFLCFSVEPGLTEDVWVTGSQVNPGNTEVVHHVLLFADPEGQSAELAGPDGSYPCFGGPGLGYPQLLAAWAPGSAPAVTPDGVAMQLKAGSRLVINVHYHPTGASQTDSSTSVDLKFSNQPPDYTGLLLLLGNFDSEASGLLPGPNDPDGVPQFVIPAGEPAHVETQRVPISAGLSLLESTIWTVGTHMHLIGRDMKLALEHPDGSETCLLQTPDWDFDWQRAYRYDVPVSDAPKPRAGDALSLRCTYDNTLDNPGTREALAEQGLSEPVDVRLGEESLDEMCLGILGLAIPGAWDSDEILSGLTGG